MSNKGGTRPQQSSAAAGGGLSPAVAGILPLVAGVVGCIIAGINFLLPHTATDQKFVVMGFAAWVVAGLIGVFLVGLYFKARADATETNNNGLVSNEGKTFYLVGLVFVSLGILMSAFQIALAVSKW